MTPTNAAAVRLFEVLQKSRKKLPKPRFIPIGPYTIRQARRGPVYAQPVRVIDRRLLNKKTYRTQGKRECERRLKRLGHAAAS